MRLAGALIALQERLPRLGDPRLGGTPPSRGLAWMMLAALGLLALFSAVYVARHAGAPEMLLRFSGLPLLSLCLAQVGLLASELLGRRRAPSNGESAPSGGDDGRPSARRVASAALAALRWFALIPAVLAFNAVLSYAAAGVFGVLLTAGFFALVVGFLWLVRRYSGPVRRRPGR